MIEKIRLDLLEVLGKSETFLSYSDSAKLKELSNKTIYNASVYQDQDSLKLAIIIYSLSKIMERGIKDPKNFVMLISEAKVRVEDRKEDEYRAIVSKLLDAIAHEDTKLGLYFDEVLEQAKVKKGGKLFEQGLSIGQASHLLGISKWELMHYVGKTSLTEEMPSLDVSTRLKFTRSLFR